MWAMPLACAVCTLTSWVDGAWVPAMQATLLLAAGAAWMLARRDRGVRGFDGAAWWLLALPAYGTIQVIAGASAYTNASLKGIVYWTALAAAFCFAAESFGEPRLRHRLLVLLGGMASALAWMALLQPYAGRLGIESLPSAAADAYAGSFANRNMYACFAELALPAVLWLGLCRGRVRWAWVASAAAIAVSVVNTGSRGGAILILAECAVLSMILTSGHKLYWKLASGIAIAAVLAAGALGDGGLAVRIQYGDPLVHRRDIYRSGIAMFAERPLAGHGLGAFSAAYPAHARFDNGRFVNLAHNDWLQLAVEGGIPLLVAFAVFTALLLGALRKGGFRRSLWALGIPVVLVHAVVDFPLHRAGVAAWWMLLAGALRAAVAAARGGLHQRSGVFDGLREIRLRPPSARGSPPMAPSQVGPSDRS